VFVGLGDECFFEFFQKLLGKLERASMYALGNPVPSFPTENCVESF